MGHNWGLHFHFSLSCTGEGNGNPLHCSCLENPRDGGAWWAAVYGVAQSRTRLKRLSSSSSSGKEPPSQCKRHKRRKFDPWVGRSPGGEHGNPLQYSCLENPMDRRFWWATVHRVTKSQTWLKRLSMQHNLVTNVRWFNHSCLHHVISVKNSKGFRESFQVSDHVESLEGWCAPRGLRSSTLLPTCLARCISSFWLFLSSILWE